MAHSRPTVIDNRGDWTRAQMARVVLIGHVVKDMRVRVCASRWRAGERSNLRATLEAMGLSGCLPWMGSHIEETWRLAVLAQPDQYIGYMRSEPPGHFEKGKAPRDAGEDIRRNAGWWYRHHCCRDSLKALGREYARQAGRRTEATSVVRNGIAQIQALLDVPDPTAESSPPSEQK